MAPSKFNHNDASVNVYEVFKLGGHDTLPAQQDPLFQGLFRGDRSGKLTMPGIPEFNDKQEERKHMKEHMAAAFRYFGKRGYGEGISGHISMRGKFLFSKLVF